MTILQFKMDLSIFNDANFPDQEGNLRLFSEFFNPFECFVKADIVKEMASMSTYQVISMTGSMHWDQWDIYTQVEFYNRVYMHVQRSNQVSSMEEVLKLMPPVRQDFRNNYLRLKKDINDWEKAQDPDQFLLERTLSLKAMELKNAPLRARSQA